MAAELIVTISFKYEKDGSKLSESLSKTVDVAGKQLVHHRQSVGTAAEALDLGEVTAGGYCLAINRDPTNFVEIRPTSTAVDTIRLKAGELACFRLSADATAPNAIADTAAVQLEYWLLSD